MHNPESVLENLTRKILSDFEIKTGYLIPDRIADLVFITKKEKKNRKKKRKEKANLMFSGVCRSSGQHRNKKES